MHASAQIEQFKAINPAVQVVRDGIEEWESSGGEDLLDVAEQLRLTPDTDEKMVVLDRYIVAGGLCYDSDASNPLKEFDGQGDLYHRGRRASGDEESAYFAALGRDSEGNPDYRAEAVSDELVENVCKQIRKDRSLMTTLSNLLKSQGKSGTWASVCKTVANAIYQEGPEYAADYFADYFLGVSWLCDVVEEWQDKLSPLTDLVRESEIEAAWERAVAKGALGEKYAVEVDIYEHGGVAYSVSGAGMQCRWDTTRAGAVWVPDAIALENIQAQAQSRLAKEGGEIEPLMHEVARDYCRGVLEEYTSWCNGEVYGVVAYVIDRNTGLRVEDLDEECWGFIGSRYAEESLDDTLMLLVKSLSAPN